MKNCLDAMTTSSVESHNNMLKRGPHAASKPIICISACSELSSTRQNVCTVTAVRLIQTWGGNNIALCGPTRDYLIHKGQVLVDRNHNA